MGMAQQVAAECASQTFQQRIQWIENKRQQGNNLFRENKLEDALNTYLMTLCALDFKTCSGTVTEEQDKMAQAANKVPILNNMAICLSKQGMH
jgi:tetratricopeptide (TPR) repeat protein